MYCLICFLFYHCFRNRFSTYLRQGIHQPYFKAGDSYSRKVGGHNSPIASPPEVRLLTCSLSFSFGISTPTDKFPVVRKVTDRKIRIFFHWSLKK